MSGFNCTCGTGGIGNIGLNDCYAVFTKTRRNIFMSSEDSSGNKFGVPSSVIVDGKIPESYFISKFNALDPADRWHITPKTYDSVVISRTDDEEETTPSGNTYILEKGVKTFVGQIKRTPLGLSGQLESCGSVSTFELGQNGELLGEYNEDGTLFYPLLIQDGSFKARNFPSADGVEQYLEITYQLDKTAKESNFIVLSKETIPEVDLLKAKSVTGYNLTETAPASATQLFVTGESMMLGTFGDYYKLREATVLTDWTIEVGGVPVVPTAITEGADGDYTIDIPSTPASSFDISFMKDRTSLTKVGATSNNVLTVSN